MFTGARKVGRWVGVGVVMTALAAASGVNEAKAQYGPRSNPITGLRTGGRYMPAVPSPFGTNRVGVGGVGTTINVGSGYGGLYGHSFGPAYGGLYGPNFGGFYGPSFGVNRFASTSYRSGFGLGGFGIGGLGVRTYGVSSVGFGAPVATSFNLSVGGFPGYSYGSPWLYGGGYPYGPVGVTAIRYGGVYPYGGIGYGGFPYGYGYGYGGGYFGY